MPRPAIVTPRESSREQAEGRALLARARLVSVATIGAGGSPALATAVPVRIARVGHAHEDYEDHEDREDHDDDLHLRVSGDLGVLPARVAVGAHEHIVSLDETTYWLAARAEGTLHHARLVGGGVAAGIARLHVERITSIAELGQSSPTAERRDIIERLWQRGLPGDARAVTFLVARFPELGTPSFLAAGAELEDRGVRLQCGVDEDELDEVLDLLQELYWLVDVPRADIYAAVVASTALVAARDRQGRIVAFARAVSDRKCAWIYDVVVAPPLRSTQIGSALMKLLLDHPDVRGVRHVRLTTRDAMTFYRRLGFRELSEAPRYAWKSTEMIRPGVAFRTPVPASERSAETETCRAVADEWIEAREDARRS